MAKRRKEKKENKDSAWDSIVIAVSIIAIILACLLASV